MYKSWKEFWNTTVETLETLILISHLHVKEFKWLKGPQLR